jgi:hypothetical protein
MVRLKYTVMVDDNFSFMDVSKRYKHGEFNSYDEAVSACKKLVDAYLESALKADMTARELYVSYTMFGEDPFIMGEKAYPYSSWKYAEQKAEELTR